MGKAGDPDTEHGQVGAFARRPACLNGDRFRTEYALPAHFSDEDACETRQWAPANSW
jgi:hypothetical protein